MTQALAQDIGMEEISDLNSFLDAFVEKIRMVGTGALSVNTGVLEEPFRPELSIVYGITEEEALWLYVFYCLGKIGTNFADTQSRPQKIYCPALVPLTTLATQYYFFHQPENVPLWVVHLAALSPLEIVADLSNYTVGRTNYPHELCLPDNSLALPKNVRNSYWIDVIAGKINHGSTKMKKMSSLKSFVDQLHQINITPYNEHLKVVKREDLVGSMIRTILNIVSPWKLLEAMSLLHRLSPLDFITWEQLGPSEKGIIERTFDVATIRHIDSTSKMHNLLSDTPFLFKLQKNSEYYTDFLADRFAAWDRRKNCIIGDPAAVVDGFDDYSADSDEFAQSSDRVNLAEYRYVGNRKRPGEYDEASRTEKPAKSATRSLSETRLASSQGLASVGMTAGSSRSRTPPKVRSSVASQLINIENIKAAIDSLRANQAGVPVTDVVSQRFQFTSLALGAVLNELCTLKRRLDDVDCNMEGLMYQGKCARTGLYSNVASTQSLAAYDTQSLMMDLVRQISVTFRRLDVDWSTAAVETIEYAKSPFSQNCDRNASTQAMTSFFCAQFNPWGEHIQDIVARAIDSWARDWTNPNAELYHAMLSNLSRAFLGGVGKMTIETLLQRLYSCCVTPIKRVFDVANRLATGK